MRRPSRELTNHFVATEDGLLETGLLSQKLPAHPPPLRSLAAEHERHGCGAARQKLADGRAAPRLAANERIESIGHLLRRVADDGCAVVVVSASNTRREADVARLRAMLDGAQSIAVPAGQRRERSRAAGREREQLR